MQRNQTWFNCNGSGIRRWYLHAVHKIWRLLLSLLNLEYTCTVTEVHLCLWIHSDDFELGSIGKCTNGIEQRVKVYKVLNSAINSASSRKPIHYTIMNWTNPWNVFRCKDGLVDQSAEMNYTFSIYVQCILLLCACLCTFSRRLLPTLSSSSASIL